MRIEGEIAGLKFGGRVWKGVVCLFGKKDGEYTASGFLPYYRIGCGALSLAAFLFGWRYSLFSIMQLGVVLGFIVFVISFFLYFWKYEEQAKAVKNIPEPEENETEEQKGKKKKAPDPVKEFESYRTLHYPVLLLSIIASGIFVELSIYAGLRASPVLDKPPILVGICSILVSFLLLTGANWFEQEEEYTKEYKMLGYFFRAGQWLSFFAGLAVVIKYLGFGQVEHILSYFIFAFMMLLFLETGIQCVIWLVDGKERHGPALQLYVLPALLMGGNPFNNLLYAMEKNMGISFRSMWTIRFVRENLLYIASILVVFFWAMTAIVQVNPQEKGILYTLGRIKSPDPLLPGIHLKWPWPLETVKIYPAYKVQSFTVGYESNKKGNYLWTMKHDGEEYKLLLGDGKELVSINMQVSYKIGDLYEYALQFESPEEKLKAEAYRILLNETVVTNLDNLLSRDRSSFSQMVSQKLQENAKQQQLGLEVVNVVLTSIHPPTEIAREYQEIVSANIQKQIIITKARTEADSAIPKAEKDRGEAIKNSQVDALARRAQSASEAAIFRYQETAYAINPNAYKEWKWLEALENALQNKKIYLVDKKQELYHGNMWLDMRSMFKEDIVEP